MKKIILISITMSLWSCHFFDIAPQPLPLQSPIPTWTPAIVSPTPLIIHPPTLGFTATETIATITQGTIGSTETPIPFPTFTPKQTTQTFTSTPQNQTVEVEILGCNTSIDILHGMGEVTNAYVIVKNTGTVDLPNTCALLRAIDEGREHPDKKVCTSNLPSKNQITYKLTVDSTYKKDTIIQVDVTTGDTILLRVDKQSCRDISLFGGVPTDTGIIKPIP